MNIVVIREPAPESRVALSPASVKSYLSMGFKVFAQFGLGVTSGWSDDEYLNVGATLMEDKQELLKLANLLICIHAPTLDMIKCLPIGALIITQVEYAYLPNLINYCENHSLGLFDLNQLPRITRAQSMDVLSSQTNLGGYRAVLLAAYHYGFVIPMMMTAAGVISPAKVLVLGAGVAGLQAIATAKRLGAEVFAFDVRSSVKEQVESLGAEFIVIDDQESLETSSGYAAEASEHYQQLQAAKIDEYAKLADIVICTALIPGKTAPILLRSSTVKSMKSSAVIVDLAVIQGGNCELSVKNKIVRQHGVTIIGDINVPGQVPGTASQLYANNVLKVIQYLWDAQHQTIKMDKDDPIIHQALILPIPKDANS